MARMPGARWRPLADNWASQPRMSRYDLVIIHTAVGSFEGTFSWFRNSGGYVGAESHFMTSGDGAIDQYQDTAHQAEANGAANPKAISTENADMGPGFQPWNTRDGNAVPAFTPAQIEANARICAWAHRTHGVPLVLVPDSKPGRRGIAYHRLGVPGYAVAGGELWSSARGKVCPADRRITQIPQIIARAQQIARGAPTPRPAPVPEDDMNAAQDKKLDDVAKSVAYLVGQLQGQETDRQGRKGWIAADGRAYTLVDLNRAVFSAVTKSLDIKALASEIVAKLPASSGGGVTKADVEDVVRGIFADASDAA